MVDMKGPKPVFWNFGGCKIGMHVQLEEQVIYVKKIFRMQT